MPLHPVDVIKNALQASASIPDLDYYARHRKTPTVTVRIAEFVEPAGDEYLDQLRLANGELVRPGDLFDLNSTSNYIMDGDSAHRLFQFALDETIKAEVAGFLPVIKQLHKHYDGRLRYYRLVNWHTAEKDRGGFMIVTGESQRRETDVGEERLTGYMFENRFTLAPRIEKHTVAAWRFEEMSRWEDNPLLEPLHAVLNPMTAPE